MSERGRLLAQIVEGDIFHAESPGGASLICLTINVTEDRINAKTVTTQLRLSFDRSTGVAEHGDKRVPCRIGSIAPLPPEVHQIMLELNGKPRPPREGDHRGLTRAQIDALMFTSTFYKSHPLAEK